MVSSFSNVKPLTLWAFGNPVGTDFFQFWPSESSLVDCFHHGVGTQVSKLMNLFQQTSFFVTIGCCIFRGVILHNVNIRCSWIDVQSFQVLCKCARLDICVVLARVFCTGAFIRSEPRTSGHSGGGNLSSL
jgi:hypothetical protein